MSGGERSSVCNAANVLFSVGLVVFVGEHGGKSLVSLSLRICCKFAHFLIYTIAKEILN